MPEAAHAPEVESLVASLAIGTPVLTNGMHIIPLLRPGSGVEAMLLEEGLAEGASSVEELDEAGQVNVIQVAHKGVKPLLLLDGEEIVGAKQNRVFNASFLVFPGAPAAIPVSCVEQGRWRYESRQFAAGSRTMSSRLRSEKLKRVTTSMRTIGEYDADQGAVWRDVDGYLTRARVSSRTRAYADGFEAQAARIEQELAKVAPLPGQVGVVALARGKLVVIEVLGSHELFVRAWPKIGRGLFAEEDHDGEVPGISPTDAARVYLGDLALARYVRTPAPGGGETLHGRSPEIVAGAVVHGGAVYHAVAGPAR